MEEGEPEPRSEWKDDKQKQKNKQMKEATPMGRSMLEPEKATLQTLSTGEAGNEEDTPTKEKRKTKRQRREESEGETLEQQGKVVRLMLNKRKPDFSREELEFFRRAMEHRHICQTHFAEPGANYCHRRPLCRKVVNGEGILRKIEIHFEMLRGDSAES